MAHQQWQCRHRRPRTPGGAHAAVEQFISCSACSVNMMSMARASLGLGLYLQQGCTDQQTKQGDLPGAPVGVHEISYAAACRMKHARLCPSMAGVEVVVCESFFAVRLTHYT